MKVLLAIPIHLPYIRDKLGPVILLPISAEGVDIENYVHQMLNKENRITPEFQKQVMTTVTKESKGKFIPECKSVDKQVPSLKFQLQYILGH
jgi:hypothetical protein